MNVAMSIALNPACTFGQCVGVSMITVMKSGIIILTLISSSARAEDVANKDCPSEQAIEFAFKNYSFYDSAESETKIEKMPKEDVCKNPVLSNVILGLDFLKKSQKTKINKKYSSPVTKEGALAFFNKRITTIKFDKQKDGQCSDVTAGYVFNDDTESKTMFICDKITALSPLLTASILVHEARHIDGYPHEICSHGELLDSEVKGCDKEYKSMGAYAIQVSYLYQIYKGKYNKAIKEEAREFIIKLSLERFNTPLPGVKKGGVFLDDEDSISFYDGKEETRFGSFTDKTSAIAIQDSYPVVFFKNGNITKYDFTRDWGFRSGNMVKNYNKLSKEEMNSLLDVFISKSEYCFLLPDKIKCATKDPKEELASMVFHEVTPLKFWNPLGYNTDDIRLVGLDDSMYYIPSSILFKNPEEAMEVKSKRKVYPGVTSYAEMDDGSLIGISTSGKVIKREKGKKNWVPAKEFGDYTFKKIVPFYWSKELEDL